MRRTVLFSAVFMLALFGVKAGTLASDSADDAAYEEALAVLDNTVIPSIDFKEEGLESVVDFMATVTGLNFVVTPEVADEGVSLTLRLSNVSARKILRLIARLKDLAIYYTDGVIVVDSKEGTPGTPYMKVYDVSALKMKINDFPGPDISLDTSDNGMPEVIFRYDPPDEVTIDDVVDMVGNLTGGDSWDDDDCSITVHAKMLIVVQRYDVHREIAWLLAMLEGMK